MLRHIKPFLIKNKSRFILSVLLNSIIDVLVLVSPWILGLLIDEISSSKKSGDDLLGYLLIIVAVECSLLVLRFFLRTLLNRAAFDVEYEIRTNYFTHLLEMDAEFFSTQKTGDLMARATNDIVAVRMMFADGLIMLMDSVLIIVAVLLITTTTISLELTMISIINLPVMALIIGIGAPIMRRRFKAMNESFGSLSEKAREFFTGIRLLKAFNKENSIARVFGHESYKLYKKSVDVTQISVTLNPLIRVMAFVSTIIAVYFGGIMVMDNKISLGAFVSFMSYLQRLTWPFMAIGFLISTIQMGVASLSRLNEVFDCAKSVDNESANPNILQIYGDIEVKNLSYAYPDSVLPALKHVSFSLEAGKTLGIIGKTGSGKTTLANLLIRRFESETESIFIDGHSLSEIPLDTLRNCVGYSFQETAVFSQTIKNNIAIKNPDMKLEEVVKYCKIAKLHDEIDLLPEKYNTMLGEKGVNLSGGQKQRLSIARALAHGPNIVILDDALSAVDNKTQAEILSALKGELNDKTAIIISHRISSIIDADKIIVLDDGFLLQSGTHDELITQDGLYKSLYEIQMEESDIKGGD